MEKKVAMSYEQLSLAATWIADPLMIHPQLSSQEVEQP